MAGTRRWEDDIRTTRHTVAFALIAAVLPSLAFGAADAVAAPGSSATSHVESVTTTNDPLGDTVRQQGDITAAKVTADAAGTTSVQVTVAAFQSPLSDDWQLTATALTWYFDVDNDSTADFAVVMGGYFGAVNGGVFDADQQLVCDATPSWDASARTYSASFATSCLKNPVNFTWKAQMAYEDASTELNSTDMTPDSGWFGPVANDANPLSHPCTPGTTGRPGDAADGFVSLVPARVLDTRLGMPTIDCQFSGGGAIGGTTELRLTVAGRAGVPANATAVVLNLTASDATLDGFVTVYPCGAARPEASSLNYQAHTTVPNAVIASIGAGGAVCLFSNAPVQLIADVNGYFMPQASFVPSSPVRVYDSRKLGQLRAAGSETAIGPFDGSSVVLNVTVTQPRTSGYATVYPCGSPRPLASNVNFTADDTAANAVIAKVGAFGLVCVFTSAAAHLVVDINGSYTLAAGYTSLVPARLLETRSGQGTIDGLANGGGRVEGPSVVQLQVAGRGGVPADASAAVLNVTVADARGPGFITVFPCGSPQPNASNLNFVAGSVLPNAVVTQVGDNGMVCFFANASTHLIVDVNGYYPAA